MKKLLFSILTSAIVMLSACNISADFKADDNLFNVSTKKIERFFSEAKENNKSAMQNLLHENENIDLNDSSTMNLVKKFNSLSENNGGYINSRLIKKRELGQDVGVYIYLVKYRTKFYRFIFTFYNNGSAIKIYKFSYDDSLDAEIEEGLKLYTE